MKLLFHLLFFTCIIGYSQNDRLSCSLINNKFDAQITFKPFIWKSSFTTKNSYLTSFNPVTGINNKYTIVGNDYFLSNTKSFSTLNALDLNRIDSFNPNGTNSIGSALIFGVLNLIFENN